MVGKVSLKELRELSDFTSGAEFLRCFFESFSAPISDDNKYLEKLVREGLTEPIRKDLVAHFTAEKFIKFVNDKAKSYWGTIALSDEDKLKKTNTFFVYISKNISAVITNDKENECIQSNPVVNKLWEMSKTYRDRRASENPLFAGNGIDVSILPTTADYKMTGEDLNIEILSAIDRLNGRSALILGEDGGSGKTATLIKILNGQFERGEKTNIPIFIELKSFPSDFKKYSNLFARYIASFIFDEGSFDIISNESLVNIRNTIREADKIRFTFLVDGMNEVSFASREIVAKEILEWNKCPNVQILATSRFAEESLVGDVRNPIHELEYNTAELALLNLKGLADETIVSYLRKTLSEEYVVRIQTNTQLMSVLRVPMFLTLFSGAIKGDSDSTRQISTRGEILNEFFKGKKEEHQRAWGADYSANCFILDYILPAIGFYMAERKYHYLSYSDIVGIIEGMFEKDSIMIKRRRPFPKKYKALSDVLRKYDRQINDLGYLECAEQVLDFIAKELCIMRKNEDGKSEKYEFLHEHLRDYFAALQIKEDMECCRDGDENISSLSSATLPETTWCFVGEISSEHRYLPYCDDEDSCWKYPKYEDRESLIIEVLNRFRGKHDDLSKRVVMNMIEILKYSRQNDLSLLNLSGLDFSDTWLGDICFSRWYEKKKGLERYASIFDDATINAYNFIRFGHITKITAILIDGNTMYSTDVQGYLKVWNIQHQYCVTYPISNDAIRCITFRENKESILLADAHNIYEFHANLKEAKRVAQLPSYTYIAKITVQGGELVYADDINPLLWRNLNGEELTAKLPMDMPSACSCITDDRKTVVISARSRLHRLFFHHYDDKKNKWCEWENALSVPIAEGNRVNSLMLSDNQERVLVAIGSHVYEFDIKTGEEKLHIYTKSPCGYAGYVSYANGEPGIIYAAHDKIAAVDLNGQKVFSFSGNSMKPIAFPNLGGKGYEGYFIVTRDYIKEFEFPADSNKQESCCIKVYAKNPTETPICPALKYPTSHTEISGQRTKQLKAEKILLSRSKKMWLVKNGTKSSIPIVKGFKLMDIVQERETFAYAIVLLGDKTVVFDRTTGAHEEFANIEGMIIQGCSMKNLQGDFSQPEYAKILKKYGALI